MRQPRQIHCQRPHDLCFSVGNRDRGTPFETLAGWEYSARSQTKMSPASLLNASILCASQHLEYIFVSLDGKLGFEHSPCSRISANML